VGFITCNDPFDAEAMANFQVFAPTEKIGEITQRIFWTPQNKRKFLAAILPHTGQEAELTYPPTMEGWDSYLKNQVAIGGEFRAIVSSKLYEMADSVLKAAGVVDGFHGQKWPYTGIANVIYKYLTSDDGISFRIYNWPITCDLLKKADSYTTIEVKALLQSIIVGFIKHSKDGDSTVLPGTQLRMEAFTRGEYT
jgi:hypothetical protein